MTLKDCTKEELIFVIERLQLYGLTAGDYYIQRALCDVEERREDQKLEKSRQLSRYAEEKHREYMELMGPYAGRPLCDIPDDVAKRADAARKECASSAGTPRRTCGPRWRAGTIPCRNVPGLGTGKEVD